MSYSSLYVIKKDFTGELVADYKNSWLFSPMVWSVLCEKYIPRDIQTPYGYKKSIITDFNGELHKKLNNKVNNCENTPDRICWEMSNQQIFFTKDKECIADGIKKFVEQNKQYDKSEEDNISPMEREHIIERFNEIAEHILEIDENKYPYFVFKNNSVDDGVEYWFREYDEETEEYITKSLDKWDKILAEFVVIENGTITKFIHNLDFFADHPTEKGGVDNGKE